jgi:PIN domain nuclease of toxin-antitoxin system
MSNSPRFLLDTHILLRFLGISGDLRRAVLPILEAAASSEGLYVSVISIWETAMLVRQGRLALHTSVGRWTEEVLQKPGLHLLPFSTEIAIESVNLPEPMHKDPADRILVASARVERLTLVTRDQQILDFAKLTKLSVLQA